MATSLRKIPASGKASAEVSRTNPRRKVTVPANLENEVVRAITPDDAGLADRTEALFAVQLKVARKADELARSRGGGSDLNLLCWLLAEAEILGSVSDSLPMPQERLVGSGHKD